VIARQKRQWPGGWEALERIRERQAGTCQSDVATMLIERDHHLGLSVNCDKSGNSQDSCNEGAPSPLDTLLSYPLFKVEAHAWRFYCSFVI